MLVCFLSLKDRRDVLQAAAVQSFERDAISVPEMKSYVNHERCNSVAEIDNIRCRFLALVSLLQEHAGTIIIPVPPGLWGLEIYF